MTAERYQRVKEIFQAAIECEPSKRPALLLETCKDEELLRGDVESLLAYYDLAEDFIERSAFGIGARLLIDDEFESLVGQTIGNYRLISILGRGGMGEVYLASRADEQFRKQVAIKIVRAGLDTPETRRRFRHERQVLASLDHPNIAKLLDSGTTEDGRPYVVMDYVEGVPITDYCKLHNLSIADRLRLFQTVCSAVQYAHQRLVIHRDIKPGNILVTSDNTPKLLDFGIAKLLDPTMSETVGLTVAELRLMTPQYASPEQVRGLEITTASDVYSLGVLLYELLTGRRPYRIPKHRMDGWAQVICEQEPDPPSTAVTRIEPEDETLTQPEQSTEKLQRQLRGDLDNIVLMAMRKEPERRYSSISEFAEDIKRYLEGLPVVARKATLAYRAAKFVRRNKVGVVAASIVLLTLLGGIVATVWQARIATAQARLAAEQRDRAETERAKAERVNAFVQEMLSSPDPLKKGGNVRVADLLADAARRADALDNQPEIQAEMRRTIGNTYAGLGLYDEGMKLLQAAFQTHHQLFGSHHAETARTLSNLATAARSGGNYTQAEELFSKALVARRSIAPNGDVETAETLIEFAALLFQAGRTDESAARTNEALEMASRVTGEDHVVVANASNLLGLIKDSRGDVTGAEPLYRRSLEIYRSIGPLNVLASYVMMNLATNLTSQGNYDEAERIFNSLIDLSQQLYGKDHPNQAAVMSHFSRVFYLKGDYQKAEALLRPALEIQRRSLVPGHPESAQTLATLGIVLTRAGRADEGEPYLMEALAIRRRALPKGHWSTANITSMLGECLAAQGRYERAEPLLRQGYEELSDALGEKHPRTIEAIQRLISLYETLKKPALVEQYRALMPTT